MTGSMQGKVALVTGAGGGIGRASATIFAANGAQVVVADLKVDGGKETVEIISDAGGDARFVECDVTDESQVEELVRFTVATFGRLDFAHNNAGISHPSVPFHELTKAAWDQMININLTSVFLCMKHEIPQMLAQGGGAIVNTASGASVVPAPGQPHYTAAKRGVAGLTAHAAQEYNQSNIRVNCVLPGMVDTPMMQGWLTSSPEIAQATLQMMPGKRLAAPEEIADCVVWLCSDGARFVSGDAMAVDGGFLCR